jgi:hypothetical protein
MNVARPRRSEGFGFPSFNLRGFEDEGSMCAELLLLGVTKSLTCMSEINTVAVTLTNSPACVFDLEIGISSNSWNLRNLLLIVATPPPPPDAPRALGAARRPGKCQKTERRQKPLLKPTLPLHKRLDSGSKKKDVRTRGSQSPVLSSCGRRV